VWQRLVEGPGNRRLTSLLVPLVVRRKRPFDGAASKGQALLDPSRNTSSSSSGCAHEIPTGMTAGKDAQRLADDPVSQANQPSCSGIVVPVVLKSLGAGAEGSVSSHSVRLITLFFMQVGLIPASSLIRTQAAGPCLAERLACFVSRAAVGEPR
jgi:hypothetical protein